MISCTILIPHLEAYDPFLKACIQQIDACKIPEIDQEIIIVDDNSRNGDYERIVEAYDSRKDIEIVQSSGDRTLSVGGAIDMGCMCQAQRKEYICMIDADCMPINELWLWLPIYLIESFGYVQVGCNTGLGEATVKAGYAPPDTKPFPAINNFYRVMPSKLALEMARDIGFARRAQSDLPPGWVAADNGVLVNYEIEKRFPGKGFNLPITSYIGLNVVEGCFGQNICDLLIHYALSSRILSQSNADIPGKASPLYMQYVEEMKAGLTADLLLKIKEASRANSFWKTYENIAARIEELKAIYYNKKSVPGEPGNIEKKGCG